MRPAIAVIDAALVLKGRTVLADMERCSCEPDKANEALLMKILRENADTEYGKKYGFADIHSAEEYKKRVPYSDYDVYAPYIQRMVKNKETNLITAYNVIQYAETSGSVGVQKKIPVTDRSMAVYEKYSFARTKAIASKHYHAKYHRPVPFEKGLNTLETETTVMDDGTPRGSVTGSVSRRFRNLFPLFLTSPDPVLFPIGGMNMYYMKARFAMEEPNLVFELSAFMTQVVDIINYMKANWRMIVDDIEHGTLNPEVCEERSRPAILPYIKPRPKRAAELRKIFEEGFDTPIVPRLWPKMAWVCAIGTGGFAVYAEKVKQYIGDIPVDYSVYAASEGIFAAASAMNDSKYDLLTDSCFFEFLPTDGTGDEKHPLTLDQLETGREYEIIITNLSGFYRYRIQDVIRVLSWHNQMPQIAFAYRISQMVNLAAEKTTELLPVYRLRRGPGALCAPGGAGPAAERGKPGRVCAHVR